MAIDMKDSGKYPLVISKVMLSFLCVWPLNKEKILKFFRYFMLLNMFCMGIPHVYYMLVNITDMAVMASACTTVSTTFQTIARLVLLSYYSEDLSNILNIISDEYWPANIAGPETEASVLSDSRLIVVMLCIYLSNAFMSSWDFGAIHLIFGRRILPLESSFPFRTDGSPVFEIIYVWQCILDQYIVINTIAAHDFFFNSLVTSSIAQFKLLKAVLASIGTGQDKVINDILEIKEGLKSNTVLTRSSNNHEYELVSKCIRHHNLVLSVCDNLQRIFGAMILLQFFVSATALCVSSFVLTQPITLAKEEHNAILMFIHMRFLPKILALFCKNFDNYLTKMLSFSIAHLIQFFFLCTVGNELIYESAAVAEGAYFSEWYLQSNLEVRRALITIIQRAQKEQKITALGFANLDYPNFVNILRMSFSFYTLLSSITEK